MFVLHLLRPVLKRRKLPIYKRRINFCKLKGLDSNNHCYAIVQRMSSASIQGGPKKTAPNFSRNNFGKYGPILITFSLLHSQMN